MAQYFATILVRECLFTGYKMRCLTFGPARPRICNNWYCSFSLRFDLRIESNPEAAFRRGFAHTRGARARTSGNGFGPRKVLRLQVALVWANKRQENHCESSYFAGGKKIIFGFRCIITATTVAAWFPSPRRRNFLVESDPAVRRRGCAQYEPAARKQNASP